MKSLPQKLISSPIFEFSSTKGLMTLHTDACDNQACCVPLQVQPDKKTKPNWFWYRSLLPLNAYKIRRNENVSRLAGRCCYHDRILRVRVSYPATTATHLSGYWFTGCLQKTRAVAYSAIKNQLWCPSTSRCSAPSSWHIAKTTYWWHGDDWNK